MDSSFAVSGPSHVRPEEYTTPMITNLATYARNMLAVHIQLCPVSTNHSVIRFLYVSVKRWSYVQFKSDLFGHTLSFSCDTYYKGVKSVIDLLTQPVHPFREFNFPFQLFHQCFDLVIVHASRAHILVYGHR